MIYEEIERAREKYEAHLIPEVEALFIEQGERIIAALEGSDLAEWGSLDAERAANDLSVAAEALALIWGVTMPPFARASYEAVQPAVKRDVPGVDEWLQEALAFIEQEGGVMIRAITETLLEDVRRVLQEGMAEGESVDMLARRLRREWPEITTRRAERIVRTEVVSAGNAASLSGAQRAAEDFGLDMEKEWLATPDGRTRSSHRAIDGQRVPMTGLFAVGGESARYPGDPNLSAGERVQCRCAVAFVPVEGKAIGWRDERDARIRGAYPAIKAKWGRLQAFAEIADTEGISERQVRRIVDEEGRA